jgi:hypothetical protein
MCEYTYTNSVPCVRIQKLVEGDVVVYFSIHPCYILMDDDPTTIWPSPAFLLAEGKFQQEIVLDLVVEGQLQKQMHNKLRCHVAAMSKNVDEWRVGQRRAQQTPSKHQVVRFRDLKAREIFPSTWLSHRLRLWEPRVLGPACRRGGEGERKDDKQMEADANGADVEDDSFFPDFSEVEAEAELAPWKYAPIELPTLEHQRTQYKRPIRLSEEEKIRIKQIIEASRWESGLSPDSEHFELLDHPMFMDLTTQEALEEFGARYPNPPKVTKAMLKERLIEKANAVQASQPGTESQSTASPQSQDGGVNGINQDRQPNLSSGSSSSSGSNQPHRPSIGPDLPQGLIQLDGTNQPHELSYSNGFDPQGLNQPNELDQPNGLILSDGENPYNEEARDFRQPQLLDPRQFGLPVLITQHTVAHPREVEYTGNLPDPITGGFAQFSEHLRNNTYPWQDGYQHNGFQQLVGQTQYNGQEQQGQEQQHAREIQRLEILYRGRSPYVGGGQSNGLNTSSGLDRTDVVSQPDGLGQSNRRSQPNILDQLNGLNQPNGLDQLNRRNQPNVLDQLNRLNQQYGLGQLSRLSQPNRLNQACGLHQSNGPDRPDGLHQPNGLDQPNGLYQPNGQDRPNGIGQGNGVYQQIEINPNVVASSSLNNTSIPSPTTSADYADAEAIRAYHRRVFRY